MSDNNAIDSRGPSAATIRWMCFLAVILEGYDMVVFGATLPAMLTDPQWNLDPATAGAVGSYAPLGMLVGALAVGAVADRWGRRRIMIAAVAWFSVGMAACAMAPDVTLFGVARFCVGIGGGALTPVAAALAVEFAPKGRSHRSSAMVWAGFPAGGVLASLAALVLIDNAGVRAMYWIGAIPLLLFVPVMIRSLPESPSFLMVKGRRDEAFRIAHNAGLDTPELPSSQETIGVRALFLPRLRRATFLLGALSACGLLLTYALNTWLPKLMAASGFRADSSLAFLLTLNAGAILVPLLASRLSDRVGPQPVTAAAFFAAAVCLVTLSLNVPLGLLYVLTFVAGAGTIGAQVLVYGFAASYYPASSRAAGTAWVASVGRVGAIAGPSMTGLVLADSAAISSVFYLFAVIALIGVGAALSVPRRASGSHTRIAENVDDRSA